MKKLLLLLLFISSCTVYKQPKPKPLHVLVVTTEGDTLKLPIGVIRPIYNYNNITYPQRSNPYDYNTNYNLIHNKQKANINNNTDSNNNNNKINNANNRPTSYSEKEAIGRNIKLW